MLETFKANTQFNDFTGTAAADSSDTQDFVQYLKTHNLIQNDEFLVGYEIAFNGNNGRSVPNPDIIAWVTKSSSFDAASDEAKKNGFKLRAINVPNLSLADFFAYFKRFNVMLSRRGIGLDGQPFDTY